MARQRPCSKICVRTRARLLRALAGAARGHVPDQYGRTNATLSCWGGVAEWLRPPESRGFGGRRWTRVAAADAPSSPPQPPRQGSGGGGRRGRTPAVTRRAVTVPFRVGSRLEDSSFKTIDR